VVFKSLILLLVLGGVAVFAYKTVGEDVKRYLRMSRM